jgi:hypothetical protein
MENLEGVQPTVLELLDGCAARLQVNPYLDGSIGTRNVEVEMADRLRRGPIDFSSKT